MKMFLREGNGHEKFRPLYDRQYSSYKHVTTNVSTKTTGMYTLHSIVMESTTITNILILRHYCFLCMELLLEIYH